MQKEEDPDFLHCSSVWAKLHQLRWVVASWNCFILYFNVLIVQIFYENLGQVGVQHSSWFIPRSLF